MSRRGGFLFVTPALLLFGVFVLYPMGSALSYAFFSWQGTTRGVFVGLGNFAALFTQEPFTTQLPRAFGHNIAFFVGTMIIQNTVGLGIAVLLHKRGQCRYLCAGRVLRSQAPYLWCVGDGPRI